jgi:hypothetical protein
MAGSSLAGDVGGCRTVFGDEGPLPTSAGGSVGEGCGPPTADNSDSGLLSGISKHRGRASYMSVDRVWADG